jgi:hypothetical protein
MTNNIVSGHPTNPMGSTQASGVAGAQQRVRSIVDGIMSPFKACVQPPLQQSGPQHPETDPQWTPPIGPLCYYRGSFEENSVPSPVRVVSSFQSQSTASTLPTMNIEAPHDNDVLCGRGGSSNRHKGNLNFRELIASNKSFYSTLTKKQKMLMARQIVDVVHHADPPGRFLARDARSGYFYDVGLPRSLEKTSQALREKSHSERAAASTDTAYDESSPDIGDDMSVSGEHREPSAVKSKTSSRNVPMPTLTIPPHLKSIYRIPTIVPPTGPVPIQVTPLYPPAGMMEHSPYITPTSMPYLSHSTPPRVPYPSAPAEYEHANMRLQHPIPPSPVAYPTSISPLRRNHFHPHPNPQQPPDQPPRIPQVPLPQFPDDERQQDWKRQRTNHGTPSEYILQAIQSQLTLEERVVGPREMMSPSGALQSRRSARQRSRGGTTTVAVRVSDDGLAALATAAFLRLDEND